MDEIEIRHAEEKDLPLILTFIRELAEYEHLAGEVVATEEVLREWLFERRAAEVIFAETGGREIGFALFFGNFSTFLGRGGIYLEDLYVREAYRGLGAGRALLRELVKAIYIGAPDKSSGKRRQNIRISYDLVGFIPVDELMKQETA